MPIADTGKVKLYYEEHGDGDNVVVFVHGNLASTAWMDLVWPHLPEDFRVIAYDWRGCGESEKPEPTEDYENYSMPTHAQDLLDLLDVLGIERCHLANHSTGGIICSYAQLMQPERFGAVLSLDPVTPRGLRFDDNGMALFRSMSQHSTLCFATLASAVPTLFTNDSLHGAGLPAFRLTASQTQRELFHKLVNQTRHLSPGVWLGTPFQLNREYHAHRLWSNVAKLRHPQRILWGEYDIWIPREDVEAMARALPNCHLVMVPGVGHAMNVEAPDRYAAKFVEFFREQVRLLSPAKQTAS